MTSVRVVPHTPRDRERYLPFPVCRQRLLTGLGPPPKVEGMIGALRRVGGRAQLLTYSRDDFRIRDRWLDSAGALAR